MHPSRSNFPRRIDSRLLSSEATQRFWLKVRKTDPHECWIWTGGASRGYGHFLIDGRSTRIVKAHRIAWTLTHGPIPIGLLVLHRCDQPRCCNPAHLWLGTYADNTADMVAKGRARNSKKALVHA